MIVGPARPAPHLHRLTDRRATAAGDPRCRSHPTEQAWPVLQDCLARYGATLGGPRFPAALPATIRSRVLTMIIQAYDSSGLALLGLREHATASALGPVRNVAKTYAYTKWLLESPDENVRLGRVYRLAIDAIDQLRQQKRMLDMLAPGSELTLRVAPMLGAGAERMSDPNSWRSTCWSRAATCSIHCCPTQASTRARYAVRPFRAGQAKSSWTSTSRASTRPAHGGAGYLLEVGSSGACRDAASSNPCSSTSTARAASRRRPWRS
jgi:hypothetical protein